MKTKAFLILLLFIGLISLPPFGDAVAGTLQDVKARGKLIVGVKTHSPLLGFLDKKGVHKGFDIDMIVAVGEVESVREKIRASNPDLVLLDIYTKGKLRWGVLADIKEENKKLLSFLPLFLKIMAMTPAYCWSMANGSKAIAWMI